MNSPAATTPARPVPHPGNAVRIMGREYVVRVVLDRDAVAGSGREGKRIAARMDRGGWTHYVLLTTPHGRRVFLSYRTTGGTGWTLPRDLKFSAKTKP